MAQSPSNLKLPEGGNLCPGKYQVTHQNMVHLSTLSTALPLECTQSGNAGRVHWTNLQLWKEYKFIFFKFNLGGSEYG